MLYWVPWEGEGDSGQRQTFTAVVLARDEETARRGVAESLRLPGWRVRKTFPAVFVFGGGEPLWGEVGGECFPDSDVT